MAVLAYIWELFKTWIYTFGVSFTNLEVVWIIIPIWLSWFFGEFFVEKKGTSFANAISNGIIPTWVGIDWIRHTTIQLTNSSFTWIFVLKYFLAILAISYGVIVIVFGIKAKKFIRFIGRIRETSYVMLVFTPLIYDLIMPSGKYFLSIVLFFPLFYVVIELIDRFTPTPKELEQQPES